MRNAVEFRLLILRLPGGESGTSESVWNLGDGGLGSPSPTRFTATTFKRYLSNIAVLLAMMFTTNKKPARTHSLVIYKKNCI